MTTKSDRRKVQKLRNNEYYNTQEMFDDLYEKSSNGYKFNNLYNLIVSEENIKLAYRNIKNNTGSKTAGTDGRTIKYIENLEVDELINLVRNILSDYKPKSVRRVEIPKDDGKLRPLGIPNITDRLIQQCIKQVLEPICEAKFHHHSYGFRPNRSAEHAIARCCHLMNRNKLHYVVDIDIKSFFDNVNHGKLLKQLWNIGIRDKTVLSIISKMLKAEIDGIGIPEKGTPQGGILSPLLSNVVLNELDWWISNQWETFDTKHNYDRVRNTRLGNEYVDKSNKFRALKKSNLKEIYIVRYADDFKIFCKSYSQSIKIFEATKLWLKERLKLNISDEKSKIVNLRNKYSEFLGFKLKLMKKKNNYVCKSHISDKAKKNIKKKLKKQIINTININSPKEVNKYNSMVLGMQNYYSTASNVNLDFYNIAFEVNRTIDIRSRNVRTKNGFISETYKKYYGDYNFRKTFIRDIVLFPIAGVNNKPPMNFDQGINNYTVSGRKIIHDKLRGFDTKTLRYLMENPVIGRSVEYNDNRISLYTGQYGECGITGSRLKIGDIECHHKIPSNKGGTDEYYNLILVKKDVHKLIHATDLETINRYMLKLKLTDKQLKKLNKLRNLVGNTDIIKL